MRPSLLLGIVVILAGSWAVSAYPRLRVTLERQEKSGKAVICPNEAVECPDGETCCSTSTADGFGCCNKANAVCCADGIHCCDQGTFCDLENLRCDSPTNESPRRLTKLTLGRRVAERRLKDMCPDGRSCNSTSTCCQINSGEFGCCPKINAVCCSDFKHCCPKGYRCEDPIDKCTRSNAAMDVVPTTAKYNNNYGIRPDKESECPDGNTCCHRAGKCGCCPLVNATCCSDGNHCCPSGYTCNNSGGTCMSLSKDENNKDALNSSPKLVAFTPTAVKPVGTIPLQSVNDVVKMVDTMAQSINNVVCPDQQSICPDGNTCCPRGGQYGCCPVVDGTCCLDGQHCCPSGYSCRENSCEHRSGDFDNNFASTSVESVGSSPQSVKCVTCPDESICPDNNTCCSMGDGKYGCCPEIDAVCCPGGLRCCPAGYSCDNNSCTWNSDKLLLNYV